MTSENIFEANLAQVEELEKVCTKVFPDGIHIRNFINNAANWMRDFPERRYIVVYLLEEDWKKNGTFLATLEFPQSVSRDLFLFSINDESFRKLLNYPKITWNGRKLLSAICERHYGIVDEVIRDKKVLKDSQHVCNVFWMPKEEASAIEINCPDAVIIKQLDKSHAVEVDSLWPHRYDSSIYYLNALLELNGGFGVFCKESGVLLSWVMKSRYGGLGLLQTVPEAQGKGYGSLITRVLAKDIATTDGLDVFGTVMIDNTESQRLFTKLGFRKTAETCSYYHLNTL